MNSSTGYFRLGRVFPRTFTRSRYGKARRRSVTGELVILPPGLTGTPNVATISVTGVSVTGKQTILFPSASVVSGFSGPISLTKDVTKIYGVASSTVWCGTITGTDASIEIQPGGGADYDNITVSVDGGAFTTIVRSSGWCTLFSGLTDTAHFVVWRYGPAWGEDGYVGASGNILSVTGSSPALTVMSDWIQAGVGFASAALGDTDPDYIPLKGVRESSATYGASTAGLGFRGNFSELTIVSPSSYVFVSVDNAAPTAIAIPALGGHNATKWTCPGGTHDYYVWNSGSSGVFAYQQTFAVGTAAAKTALTVQKRLHHIGHSLVEGAGATSAAHTDLALAAARKGYIFSNFGRSGNTINDLKLRIDSLLSNVTVGTIDVAVLDIGRNDGDPAMTSGEQTDYEYVISACLTKGYARVLCLGALDDTGWDPAPLNTSIQSMVTGLANSKVVFVDRSAYVTITRPDGTHPSDAGYLQMDTYNQTYLDPYLVLAQTTSPNVATISITGISPNGSPSGTVTVSGGVGTVTSSGVSPAVSATGSVTRAPAVGTVTLTGVSPVTNGSGSVSRAPDFGTVTLTGVSPGANAAGAVAETPGIGTVNLSATSPAYTLGTVTLSPGVGTVTLSGIAPSASSAGGGNQTATPNVGSITLTGISPAVSGTGSVTTVPNVGTVILTGILPTGIGTGTVTGSPSAGTVVLTGASLAVTTGGVVTRATDFGTITIAGTSPTISGIGTSTGTPQTAVVTLSGTTAGASSAGTLSALPNVGNVTLTGISPSVAGSGTSTSIPSTGVITLSGVSPSGMATGIVTRLGNVGTVIISGATVSGLVGAATVTPNTGIVTLTGIGIGIVGGGTGIASATVATVTLISGTVTATALGIINRAAGVSTVGITGTTITGSASGSVTGGTGVVTIPVAVVGITAALSYLLCVPGIGTIVVTGYSVEAVGGSLITPPTIDFILDFSGDKTFTLEFQYVRSFVLEY